MSHSGATLNADEELPLFVPEFWVRRGKADDGDYSDTYQNIIAYRLTPLQRLFVTLEYPNSSWLSRTYSIMHTAIIILCVMTSFMGSVDKYQTQPDTCYAPACQDDATLCPDKAICAPEPMYELRLIDFMCFIFYSVDLGLRALLTPFVPSRILGIVTFYWDREEMDKDVEDRLEEPEYKWYEKSLRYLVTYNNLIDLCATVPFLVAIVINGGWVDDTRGASAYVLTAVRLARCVRLLKLMDIHPEGSPRLNIILKSLHNSVPSLTLLFCILIVSAVVFGSIIYTCEHGFYKVTTDYPEGEYYRTDLMGDQEVTPFRDLGSSMYWAVVTMTTLGYGDLYPSTPLGRVVGSFCVIYGIVLISLPITVVNNAFSAELDLYKAAMKVAKKVRKKTARRLKNRIKEKYRRNIESGETLGPKSTELEAEIADLTKASNSSLPPVIRKSKIISDGMFSVPYEKREVTKTMAEAEYGEIEEQTESEFMSKSARIRGDFGRAVEDNSDIVDKNRALDLSFMGSDRGSGPNTSKVYPGATTESPLASDDKSKGEVYIPGVVEMTQQGVLDRESGASPLETTPAAETPIVASSSGGNVTTSGRDRTTRMSVSGTSVGLAHREATQISAMQKELHTIKSALLKLEEAFDDILYSHADDV